MRFKIVFAIICSAFLLVACTNDLHSENKEEYDLSSENPSNPNYPYDFSKADLQKVYFAGGCFWGVEAFFEQLIGVYDATSGYANGTGGAPSYDEVIQGDREFAETVEVTYDPEQISLGELLDDYFLVIDPTSLNKQGNDRGIQYRTGIYYTDSDDEPIIMKRIKEEQSKYDEEIVTEVAPLNNYYLAEAFHQDYLEKNPNGYCHIDLSIIDDIQ